MNSCNLHKGARAFGVAWLALLTIATFAARAQQYIEFNLQAITVGEEASQAVMDVIRSGSTNIAANVEYHTTDQSALGGQDYGGQSGVISFSPGETIRRVQIPLLNDCLYETNETFLVLLSHPSAGAELGAQSNIVVTIVDNDLGIGFGGPDLFVEERFPAAQVHVLKNSDCTNHVTVEYKTEDGTATAGSDYVAQTGTLSFEGNETDKLISIPLINDAIEDHDETFYLVLSNPQGGPMLSLSRLRIIIWDCDDNGLNCESGIEFDSAVYAVAESAGGVTLGVRRGDDANSTLTVDYWTTNGTARAGIDYLQQSGTLTLLPGVTNRSLTIPVLPAASIHSPKTFSVYLGNPGAGGELGARRVATVKILDDAQPGALDLKFNPSPSLPAPNAVVAQSDGRIVVGYSSPSLSEVPVFRLMGDGSVDPTFVPQPPASLVGGRLVQTVAVHPTGRILYGGMGSLIDVGWGAWFLDQTERDGSSSLELGLGFEVGAPPEIFPWLYQLHIQSDQRFLAAGTLTRRFNGLDRVILYRFLSSGQGDASFQPVYSASLSAGFSVLSQPDGRILLGGSFSEINGMPYNNLVRLLADGTVDNSFHNPVPTNGCDGSVWAIVPAAAGKVLIAGGFNHVQGIPRTNLARLNPDGTVDTSFPAGPAPNGLIRSMAPQGDQRILICGYFTEVGGISRPYIARLNADGSVDETFDTGSGPNAPVYAMTVLPDGDVVILGGFSSVNGVARLQLAKLKTYVLRLEPPVILPGGLVQLVAHGQPGTRIISEASTDLSAWTPFATNEFAGETLRFTNAAPPGSVMRFFRAIQ